MSYYTKLVNFKECIDIKNFYGKYYYRFFGMVYQDINSLFDEMKIDDLIIKTNKDELFEFEYDDQLEISYMNNSGSAIRSKIIG